MVSFVYEYSSKDRLIWPHKYMYTPFEGTQFFLNYFNNREEAQRRIVNNKVKFSSIYISKGVLILRKWLTDFSSPEREVLELFELITDKPVDTEQKIEPTWELKGGLWDSSALLKNLIILSERDSRNQTQWKIFVDHFVQRFEVSKKLYEKYSDNFRKGVGSYENINIYILAGIIYADAYFFTKNIRYFNVWLKLMDSLVSLVNFREIDIESQVAIKILLSIEEIVAKSFTDELGGFSSVP